MLAIMNVLGSELYKEIYYEYGFFYAEHKVRGLCKFCDIYDNSCICPICLNPICKMRLYDYSCKIANKKTSKRYHRFNGCGMLDNLKELYVFTP